MGLGNGVQSWGEDSVTGERLQPEGVGPQAALTAVAEPQASRVDGAVQSAQPRTPERGTVDIRKWAGLHAVRSRLGEESPRGRIWVAREGAEPSSVQPEAGVDAGFARGQYKWTSQGAWPLSKDLLRGAMADAEVLVHSTAGLRNLAGSSGGGARRQRAEPSSLGRQVADRCARELGSTP